ncbi:MAG: hypothetical protein ACRC2V_18055, partial [Xenococcaceae cyanobacterium]
HLNFSTEHPSHIKDGFLISGFVGGLEDPGEGYEIVSNAIHNIANDAGLNLIPAYTNIYAHFKDLDDNFAFWRSSYHGALLASVGHAFANRLTSISIAATYDIAHIDPWGSHPLLDVNYSSRRLKVKHENVNLSRLEKTKLIADWDVVRNNLCICNDVTQSYRVGKLNCGKCEKCVRTMTGLKALGILERFNIFPDIELTEQLIYERAKIIDTYEESCYAELIEPLKAQGRHDLVKGINRAIERFHEKDIKGTIKRFDRTFLKGNLAKFGKNKSASKF